MMVAARKNETKRNKGAGPRCQFNRFVLAQKSAPISNVGLKIGLKSQLKRIHSLLNGSLILAKKQPENLSEFIELQPESVAGPVNEYDGRGITG